MSAATDAEAAWHAERAKSIGASEVPTVLGLNPYESAEELWAVKTGVAERKRPKSRKREWGQRIEPIIGLAYGEKHDLLKGDTTIAPNGHRVWRNPRWPFLHATPDYVVTNHVTALCWPVETKNGTRLDRRGERVWGERKEPPPIDRVVQLQTQIAVMGAPFGVLVALVDGWDYREWTYTLDHEFLAVAIPRLERFWQAVTTKDRTLLEAV